MVIKQKTYETLICLTIVCFGFFGSLSHIFSLSLIILCFSSLRISEKKTKIEFKAKVVFLAVSGCFISFFIVSIVHSNFGSHLQSLSPMLPLPLIGMLIIFHGSTGVKLSAKMVAQFSQISVVFSFLVYILLALSTKPDNILYTFYAGRLTLFSGNPIPFSFCMLGLSIFCLADWRTSATKSKIFSLLFFLVGAYFSGVLSGTRGTLLSIFIILPIIILYISNRPAFTLIFTLIFTAVCILVIKIDTVSTLENSYIVHIKNAVETLILLKKSDGSILLRLEMWLAAIKAISDAPLLGYGITERFAALRPYLHDTFPSFTHPHNDIIAGTISIGFIGGVATLISLNSGIIASFLAPNRTYEKFLFGLMISCTAMITGNVSTVLFNDIASAWLAFSVYLVWATDFKKDNFDVSEPKQ